MMTKEFTFADILSRRGDFKRDVRSVFNGKGQLIECRAPDSEADNLTVARLWMSDASGDKNTVMTVIVYFDPCRDNDVVAVPEHSISFSYRWNGTDFNTEKLMLIMDVLCGEKTAAAALCEWELLSVAAAVCAVYEYTGNLKYDVVESGMLREILTKAEGFEYFTGFYDHDCYETYYDD